MHNNKAFKCKKYKKSKADMNKMLDELKLHIEELKKNFGEFQYADLHSCIDINRPHVYTKDEYSMLDERKSNG